MNEALRPIDRRTFLWLVAITPVSLLAACKRQEENPTLPPLPGRLIEGGGFVDDRLLTQLYIDAITNQRPVTPDPTIFKTTAKLTMEQNGLSSRSAQDRANNMRIATTTELGTTAAARTRGGSDGITVLISQDAFDHTRPGQNPVEFQTWRQVLWLISHESTHASPNAVDNKPMVEDLGPLGKMRIRGNRYGFFADEVYEGTTTNLVQFNVRFVQNGPIETIHLAEEIAGELGRINFMKRLAALGLDKVGVTTEFIYDIQQPYRFLRQALIDVYDPFWHQYTNGAISPDSIMRYHQASKRSNFHLELGKALVKQNKHTSSLTDEAIRGIGVLGFAAFIFAGEQVSDPRPVLTAMREQPLTDAAIIQRSQELVAWIRQIYRLN